MKRIVSLVVSLAVVSVLAQNLYAQSMEMTTAKLAKSQRDTAKAIEWFEKAVAKKPDNPESHYLLGELYGQKGRMADMIREFDASRKYSKKYEKDIQQIRQNYFGDNVNKAINAFNKEQNFPKALEYFNKAKLIQPDSLQISKFIAITYVRLDSVNQAIKIYEELLNRKPGDYEINRELANIYNQREEYGKAAPLYERASAFAPDSLKPGIISALGVAYDYMGERDKAVKTYQDALKMNPGNKDLLFNLGRIYAFRDDYINSIKQFTAVLSVDPDDFDANHEVGRSYLKIGENLDKQATELDREATRDKKKSAKTARIDSLRQVANENFSAAMPYLKKAVELKPERSNAWYHLGVGYTRANDGKKAKEAFAKADSLAGNKN